MKPGIKIRLETADCFPGTTVSMMYSNLVLGKSKVDVEGLWNRGLQIIVFLFKWTLFSLDHIRKYLLSCNTQNL